MGVPRHGGLDVGVVGGGIAGVTLAVGLLSRGIRVTLYEQAASFTEIGAGVAFGPNAARAMDAVDPKVTEAYSRVKTSNGSPEKKDVWFDFVDGYHQEADSDGREKFLFSLDDCGGCGNTHRAHFLDELVKLVPAEHSHFNKHLNTIIEHPEGPLELHFHDGTIAHHHAVIGCDGIKSKVRRHIFGEDSVYATPQYTHKYAYRGLIPMDKAVEALGEDMARNSHFHLGPNGHFLTFPVAGGKTMNVVAFHQDDGQWTNTSKLTAPAQKKDAQNDFHDWHPEIQRLMSLLLDDLDRWAIFDLGDHPLPFFNRGRICLMGDAAHATSPHHGAGAGFCIEDSAVMAGLLDCVLKEAGSVPTHKAIELAFAAFDASRRQRTQWLVQSSRHISDLYDWRNKEAGSDGAKIYKDLAPRCRKIWDGDAFEFTRLAKQDLRQRLAL